MRMEADGTRKLNPSTLMCPLNAELLDLLDRDLNQRSNEIYGLEWSVITSIWNQFKRFDDLGVWCALMEHCFPDNC